MNPTKNNGAVWNWAVSTDGPVPPSSSWSPASPPFPGRRGEGLSCRARNPTLLTSGPWWLREVPTHGLGLRGGHGTGDSPGKEGDIRLGGFGPPCAYRGRAVFGSQVLHSPLSLGSGERLHPFWGGQHGGMAWGGLWKPEPKGVGRGAQVHGRAGWKDPCTPFRGSQGS